MAGKKVQVLFVCTGNSARSQMAQEILRKAAGHIADVYSAGTAPVSDVHPLAKSVMTENGIDSSDRHPKNVKLYLGKEFDVIITTCDGAKESCPFFPGKAIRYHWGLEDPASAEGNEEELMNTFRRTFADLSERITELTDVIQEIYGEA